MIVLISVTFYTKPDKTTKEPESPKCCRKLFDGGFLVCEEAADLLAYFFKSKYWSEKEQHFLLTFCIIKLELKLISSIMYLVTCLYHKMMFTFSSKPQQIFI